ncbi:MAG: ATP-binding protein [Planctomycetes bacterium]|nr:ATP-binding protein [Planctomycetota bacterium]
MLRLSSLQATNAKCLGEVRLDLDPRWNVILGDNACGKSTLLKAMAVACLGRFATEVEQSEWLRQGATSLGLEIALEGTLEEAPELEGGVPALALATDRLLFKSLEAQGAKGESASYDRRWEVSASGEQNYGSALGFAGGDLTPVVYGKASSLSLGGVTPVVFIPALRLTGTSPDSIKVTLERAPSPSSIRAEVISRAVRGTDSVGDIFTRLGQAYLRESVSRLQKDPTHQCEYASYQEAVRRFMPSYDLQPFSIAQGRIDITNKRCKVPFGRLSDGEKSSLGIVLRVVEGVLYSRAAFTLDQLDQPAIILIDELDAHLHPSWQRTIIRRLNSLCPKAQFIVATHSPLVLSGLVGLKTSFAIHRLIPSEQGVRSESVTSRGGALLGEDLPALLGKLFGTTDLPERVQELQHDIAQLLQKADEAGLSPDEEARLDKAQSELDWLSGLGSEPGQVAGGKTPSPCPR